MFIRYGFFTVHSIYMRTKKSSNAALHKYLNTYTHAMTALYSKKSCLCSQLLSHACIYSSCWPAAQQYHCNTNIFSCLLQKQAELYPFFSFKIAFLCVVRNSTKNTSRRYQDEAGISLLPVNCLFDFHLVDSGYCCIHHFIFTQFASTYVVRLHHYIKKV